jgi:general secretion pathway protein D
MKTTTLILILFLTALELWAQPSPSPRRLPQRANIVTNNAPVTPAMPSLAPASNSLPSLVTVTPKTASTNNTPPEEMIPAGNINFQGVDVSQVLDVYAQLVGRTMLRAGLPAAQIILRTETPLTKTEAIQALQAVLALNNIALVNVGDKFVKVLPIADANSAGAKIDHGDASLLPEMGSYVTHIVQLKYIKPSVMMPLILPFAKLANAIFPIDDNGILVLRDNAENVKRMLEMIDQIDVSVPAEYISEVIPIKYAMAEDIASALNSLGGSGGSTVSFGSSAATPSVSGISRPGGTGGTGGLGGGNSYQGGNNPNQSRALGSQATPGGTPTGGTTFQQRLQSIIQRASTGGQPEPIQVFGQTKIIADVRSNSLLVFATAADMVRIKEVVAKLDVLLSQVLIESVIVEVTIGHTFSLGVSAVQNPTTLNSSVPIIGGGGMNNGQPFMHFLQTLTTNGLTTNGLFSSISSTITGSAGTNGSFGNNLPGGFSYFGSIGQTWDVALTAIAGDNSATVIQRPRIQTSQAKAASFFVGQTVPYVTGSYYGGGYNGGNSSQYSQLSVGVELDVTPFINPDGLVVMDIQQEIDDIAGYSTIDGNPVPNTTKRTLSSEIAVRDRDTIILGGFVKSNKSTTRSGVPWLQDIPLLGNLFSKRDDSKDRDETIVLIRPTVLKTPELAATQAIKEQQRLPGIAHAVTEDEADQRKQAEAERRAELRRVKAQGHKDSSFNPLSPNAPVDTNTVAPLKPQ